MYIIIENERDNILYREYLRICSEYFDLYENTKNELLNLTQGDSIFDVVMSERALDFHSLSRKHFREYSIIVVFFSLALESYVFDLGVTLLGDSHMKKIEQVSIYQKWAKVLEKSFQVNLSTDFHELDSLLKKLISTRRRLVHSKSEKHIFPKSKMEADQNWVKCLEENQKIISIDEIQFFHRQLIELLSKCARDNGKLIPKLWSLAEVRQQI